MKKVKWVCECQYCKCELEIDAKDKDTEDPFMCPFSYSQPFWEEVKEAKPKE